MRAGSTGWKSLQLPGPRVTTGRSDAGPLLDLPGEPTQVRSVAKASKMKGDVGTARQQGVGQLRQPGAAHQLQRDEGIGHDELIGIAQQLEDPWFPHGMSGDFFRKEPRFGLALP